MNLENIAQDLIGKLQGWLEAAILGLPNFVAALLIVLLFALLARLARKLLRGVLDRVSSYHQVNNLLATLAYVGVLAAGVFVALGILGLEKTVTSLLAGAGIIGLALGFAFQDIAENFIAGILLSVRRPFREGDVVETNDFIGVADTINLRSTILRTFEGQTVLIPNASVYQNPIKNYSELGRRRIDLSCGVAYGDDLEKAKRVTLEAIQGVETRDTSREVDFYYTEFGGSSINFTVRYWVRFSKQTDYLEALSDGIMRLKRAFDENDLTIPFPIRTLDFGVVGGEKLSEVLPAYLYERGNGNAAPSPDRSARSRASDAT